MPVLEERAIPLNGWTVLVGWDALPFSVARFHTPPGTGNLHARLRLPPGAHAWLNGTRLSPNAEGDFDLEGLLERNEPNRLAVAGAVAAGSLVVGPRVYVARQTLRRDQGRLLGEVWVRNTLENTVNAYVTVSGPGVLLESPATVPPGVTQIVRLESRSQPLPAGGEIELETRVEKEEEAMERGYTVVSRWRWVPD